jgi:hypothetical protein
MLNWVLFLKKRDPVCMVGTGAGYGWHQFFFNHEMHEVSLAWI